MTNHPNRNVRETQAEALAFVPRGVGPRVQLELWEAEGYRYTTEGWTDEREPLFRFWGFFGSREDALARAEYLRRRAGMPAHGDEDVTGVRAVDSAVVTMRR